MARTATATDRAPETIGACAPAFEVPAREVLEQLNYSATKQRQVLFDLQELPFLTFPTSLTTVDVYFVPVKIDQDLLDVTAVGGFLSVEFFAEWEAVDGADTGKVHLHDGTTDHVTATLSNASPRDSVAFAPPTPAGWQYWTVKVQRTHNDAGHAAKLRWCRAEVTARLASTLPAAGET